MKILFFIPSLTGGAERVACTISKILAKVGHDVSICLVGRVNQLATFLPAEAKISWYEREKFTDGLIGTMWRTIREERPDYVFGTESAVNWRLVVAVWMSRHKPKIVLRNEIGLYRRNFSQKLRLRLTYPFAKAIIAQTDEMRDECIKVLHLSEKKVVTIPNPIDRSFIDEKMKEGNPFTQEEQKLTKFVAAGRFDYSKGFDMLVKAFHSVRNVLSNSKLFILGRTDESSHYHEVMQLIDKYDLNDSVVLTGYQTNPYVFMHYADCFVLSSRNEGLPNVMIEAMYCGTPVAAFKCVPVIERIVEEGKTGFLAEKEDEEGLAKAMLRASKLGRIVSPYPTDNDDELLKLFED